MANRTSMVAKRPVRYRRSKVATALVRELLLLNVDIETIATKVALPNDAFRRLYRTEIDEFGASGAPSHVPTAHSLKQARYCGMIGLSHADIRRILCISQAVYEDSYREAVEDGRSQGKLHVAKEMFRKATKQSDAMPNVTAGIFWLKARADWKEAEALEISGPDGGPIQTQTAVVVIPANGRDEELFIDEDGNKLDGPKT